jgi:betaine reductase
MKRAVIRGTATVLAHVPGLVRHGFKPSRELAAKPDLLPRALSALRPWPEALGYRPHQAFLGSLHPRTLGPRPWLNRPLSDAPRFTPFGEIMPEEEFVGFLALADDFGLVRLDRPVAEAAAKALVGHPVGQSLDPGRLERTIGHPEAEAAAGALPLHLGGAQIAGSVRPAHTEDESLSARVILENLACKATGALALGQLLERVGLEPGALDYVLGCGEEAVGDRYQRGGGNMGKAIAAMLNCGEASGADVKNFCAAPIPAMVIAASLVSTGVFERVAVVGGGSLAKLGMKFLGHLGKGLPILEDVLAAIAVLITPDDGSSPVIRLDSVGRHRVRSGASAQAIMEALVTEPLERLGLNLTDVDEYATELHNPEITEPEGSGNIPERNYRLIAALAARRGLIGAAEREAFVEQRGMPGFAPTQGHIASAFSYAGWARRALTVGEARRVMLLAKGSLFLGRMCEQSDGMSVLLERNGGE